MATKRRSYTPEFRQEAVRLVREEGLTFTQVAANLGVHKTVIRDWCRAAERAPQQPPTAARPMSLEEEVARLRRENSILREEREILKKAAAFFAKETR
jgi:transposase